MITVSEACAIVKRNVSAEQAAAVLYGVQANRQHYAACPFHGERTPSLRFFKDGGFKCFGCGASGSAIDFVIRMDGCRVTDAVAKISEAFGLGIDLRITELRAYISMQGREATERAFRDGIVAGWKDYRRALIFKRDSLDILYQKAASTPKAERTGEQHDMLPVWQEELIGLEDKIRDADANIARLQRWPEVTHHAGA